MKLLFDQSTYITFGRPAGIPRPASSLRSLSAACLVLAAAALLAGCSSRAVMFTSEPPGAVIAFDDYFIGETPFLYEVRGKFGFDNKYRFRAILPGHRTVSKDFVEDSWQLHVDKVVPERVHFELPPREDKLLP